MSFGCHVVGVRAPYVHAERQGIADIDLLVGRAFSVDPAVLRAPRRGAARSAFARQVAIYLAHIGLGLSLTEVAAVFDRDRTTVAHACRVVERRRDDPEIDATVGMLERALDTMSRPDSLARPRSIP